MISNTKIVIGTAILLSLAFYAIKMHKKQLEKKDVKAIKDKELSAVPQTATQTIVANTYSQKTLMNMVDEGESDLVHNIVMA